MKDCSIPWNAETRNRTGFVASAFDFLHAGHLAMLEEAKANCDRLVVGLHVNPQSERPQKNSPTLSVSERFIALRSCAFVDLIVPYETESELVRLIKLVNPDVRFLGDDYRTKGFTGSDLKIPIHWISRQHDFSSTDIRNRLKAQ